MICCCICRCRGESVNPDPPTVRGRLSTLSPFCGSSCCEEFASRRCTCLATRICIVRNLAYTSVHSSSRRLMSFSMRSSRSCVPSGSFSFVLLQNQRIEEFLHKAVEKSMVRAEKRLFSRPAAPYLTPLCGVIHRRSAVEMWKTRQIKGEKEGDLIGFVPKKRG